jgi:S-adenosylmethionine-dependent methyltransferase
LLSLVAPNPASDVLAAVARDLDLARAESLLTATTVTAVTFDHEVSRIEPAAAVQMVTDAGLELVERYGGRMLMDLVADDAVKHEPETYARLEKLEIALCATPPYRDIGRFWQIVARRPASAV